MQTFCTETWSPPHFDGEYGHSCWYMVYSFTSIAADGDGHFKMETKNSVVHHILYAYAM